MGTFVLITDGLPSDKSGFENDVVKKQFIDALRSFESMPVNIVVRLCTDSAEVFDFYTSIKTEISVPYDIIDDFFGEALNIYLHNPWLNYALSLHRFREMGLYVTVFDKLGESELNFGELRDFCSLLFSAEGNRDVVV